MQPQEYPWGAQDNETKREIYLRLSLALEVPDGILDQPYLAARRQHTGPLPSPALSLQAVPFMGL